MDAAMSVIPLNLSSRQLMRFLAAKKAKIDWDTGTSIDSEWVSVSRETSAYEDRLKNWLQVKQVAPDSIALYVIEFYSKLEHVRWVDITTPPFKYFSNKNALFINEDMDWVLEYHQAGIARFGRYVKTPQSTPPMREDGSGACGLW